ncbi:hypothetical protein GCK32_011738, partial [Trichostrongylus colubriformis]
MRDSEAEQNRKSVREFEIKYKKLESIFNQEREKMNAERSRTKSEITALKKVAEDAEELLEKNTQELSKKESAWKTEKSSLEKEIASLKKQLSNYSAEEAMELGNDPSAQNTEEEDTSKTVRHSNENLHLTELKKQLSLYEKKRDNEAHQHKARQAEKIRIVEMDALQQKFSSRMRIMEDTNKSLHSQLVLARRERDTQKEALASFERKVVEDRKENDSREKEILEAREKIEAMQKALSAVEAELERANTDLRITKEARKADQILWKIDRAHGHEENLSHEDFLAIEQLQSQFRDCERFYVKETERLNESLRTMSKELERQKSSHDKIITEIRIVEMDALQQKFSSRMRIMEDTNKSLHSQLVLARRERDTQKEALASFERKVVEDRKENDSREKEILEAREKIEAMQKALSAVEAELERANTDLRITKEARKADQILWKIDRAHGHEENLSHEDFLAIEQLQSQFRDCERFYVKETERLNESLRTMSKELERQKSSHDKIITE